MNTDDDGNGVGFEERRGKREEPIVPDVVAAERAKRKSERGGKKVTR